MEMFIKTNWRWFALYMLLYIFIYGALCMRFGLGVEDVRMQATSVEWIANGRWLNQILREIVGHGPGHPASGLLAGALISATLVIHTSLFRLTYPWQKVCYAVIYLACMQWAFMLRYAYMCDAVGLSMLSASAAALYLTRPNSLKQQTLAGLLTCLCVAGYQTMMLYLIAIIMLLTLQQVITGEPFSKVGKFILTSIIATTAGLVLYFVVDISLKSLVPEEKLAFAEEYQKSMLGWPDFLGLTAKQFIIKYANYAIFMPLHSMMGLRYPGQWVFSSSLIAYALVLLSMLRNCRFKRAAAFAILGAMCIYVPETMTAIMPGWVSDSVRIKVAEPLVAAGMWALFFSNCAPILSKHKQYVWLLCTLLYVKATFMGAVMARDEAFYFKAAMEELRSIYHTAVAEAKVHCMQDYEIVLCGHVNNAPDEQMFPLNKYGYYLDQPLPYFIHIRSWIKKFAKYARIQNIRESSEEETALYQEQLSSMPAWPNIGGVSAVSDNVILIKLGD